MNDHWRVIDNCLIYTGLDFVVFVEPANKPNIVMWQVRITKGDGSEDKSVIINYCSAVRDAERFFNLSIPEQRDQFERSSRVS